MRGQSSAAWGSSPAAGCLLRHQASVTAIDGECIGHSALIVALGHGVYERLDRATHQFTHQQTSPWEFEQ